MTNPGRRLLLTLPLLLAAAPSLRAAASRRVVYPRREDASDRRDDFQELLLKMVLAKSGQNYEAVAHEHPMMQPRLLRALEDDGGLDVIWTVTTTQREERLLPVRIPLDRGMGGWRLLLVRKADLKRFANIESLEQLKGMTAGQGAGWPDVDILRSAGLNVVTSADYASLFRMLAAKHFDYFPRAISEIWAEIETQGRDNLAIEPHLALHYPSAAYFFVNRKRPELAIDIARGFEASLRDGSYAALFQRFYGSMLERAQLRQRRVLALHNSLLPPQTPLDVARYWLRP